MEDESCVAAGPRGLAGPDDEMSVSPTATPAEDHSSGHGLMQQQKQQQQEEDDDGVAAGEPGPSPSTIAAAETTTATTNTSTTTATTTTGDEGSHSSSGTTPTPTAIPTPTSAQDSSAPKSPPPSADISTSPRGGSTAGFVAPSDYLRPIAVAREREDQHQHRNEHWSGTEGETAVKRPMHPLDREQKEGLRAIRAFLKVRTTYDVLPLSYRLIVLDTALLVRKSLNILIQCGIVSAPLWDSKTSTYAGLLTTSDYLNVVQYYWQNPDALAQIDQFKLNSLRDIERALGVTPIETVSIHPLKTLYEACRRMLESRARRIPLVDIDDETQREMVVSVLTQYRILKFVSVNVKETQMLRKPLRDLRVGSYENLSFAHMDSPVIDVIQALVKRSISCVPILDKEGMVLNVFEAVDVIALIKGGDYDNLQTTVGKALEKRSDDFPGIYTCTLNDRLDTIFDTIRKSRVHRLVVIDERSHLVGLLSLSDILDYTLNSPLGDDDEKGAR